VRSKSTKSLTCVASYLHAVYHRPHWNTRKSLPIVHTEKSLTRQNKKQQQEFILIDSTYVTFEPLEIQTHERKHEKLGYHDE
jgi:hypothetical protein